MSLLFAATLPSACQRRGGGGRVIIDCSKPAGESVNNYVDKVAVRFSYKSVNMVAELMLKGKYMSILDIKDAYHALMTAGDRG